MRKKIKKILLLHPHLNPYRFSRERFLRNLTRNKRMLPDFLIVGYHKAGTTSLYDYLTQYKNIGSAYRKEVNYFSFSYWRGLDWYKTNFPTFKTKKKIENETKIKFLTGEASPYYIFSPLSLERIHKDLPNIKIIVLLRNPIDRAYSHYMHKKRLSWEPANSFEEAIKEDEERFEIMKDKFMKDELHEYDQSTYAVPYLSIGKYHIHIKKLMKIISAEQILILKSTELSQMPEKTMEKVLNFLKISTNEKIDFKKSNVGKYDKMNNKTREKLIEYYKPHNKELEKILGIELDWDK